MQAFLSALILGTFAAIVFLNLYFRIKVLHHYRKLRDSNVAFDPTHLLNHERLRAEVLPKYPEHADDMMAFAKHIQFSLWCASALIVLITAFAAVYMFIK
jgi:uncharacterized membrane protein YjfL (UPF0719 family)